MATALIDQWTSVNGPLPQLTVGNGNDSVANAAAMTAQHFRDRVQMAMLTAAINIAAEPTNTADHANRAALAKAALAAPQTWAFPFASALAAQTLDDTSTDAQISTSVASVWNALAG